MVTLSCCQNCLEHGTSEVIYDRDGEGNPALRDSDIDVKRKLSLSTDFSFPVYGFDGQERYSKYYGYAAVVEVVGTVFFTKKPEYGSTQGFALLEAVISIFPLLAIAVVFAYIAGVIMWALVSILYYITTCINAGSDWSKSEFGLGHSNKKTAYSCVYKGDLLLRFLILSDEKELISYKCSSFVYSHSNILR